MTSTSGQNNSWSTCHLRGRSPLVEWFSLTVSSIFMCFIYCKCRTILDLKPDARPKISSMQTVSQNLVQHENISLDDSSDVAREALCTTHVHVTHAKDVAIFHSCIYPEESLNLEFSLSKTLYSENKPASSCFYSLKMSKPIAALWRSKGRDVFEASPHFAIFMKHFTATGSWGTYCFYQT